MLRREWYNVYMCFSIVEWINLVGVLSLSMIFDTKMIYLTPIPEFRPCSIDMGMGSANERRRYIVTSSPISWAHTHNDSVSISGTKQRPIVFCVKLISRLEGVERHWWFHWRKPRSFHPAVRKTWIVLPYSCLKSMTLWPARRIIAWRLSFHNRYTTM